jgi:hypothetical protein
MSPKSKYNRRSVSPKKTQDSTQGTPTASQATQAQEPQPVSARNLRQSSTANTAAKTMLDMNVAADNFKSEIKWISLVTVLILILLVASFFIFR